MFIYILFSDITVGFAPDTYMFPDQTADVNLMLVVSGLSPGVLECDINVEISYNDGPKASRLPIYTCLQSC